MAKAIIQKRNDHKMDGDRGSEVGEKWSDSGYSLNIEPTGFADRMDRGYERKRSIEDDSKVLA